MKTDFNNTHDSVRDQVWRSAYKRVCVACNDDVWQIAVNAMGSPWSETIRRSFQLVKTQVAEENQ